MFNQNNLRSRGREKDILRSWGREIDIPLYDESNGIKCKIKNHRDFTIRESPIPFSLTKVIGVEDRRRLDITS